MPIPNYKDIIELLKKGMTVEAQEQIMALREGTMELQEENLSLKSEVIKLKEKLKEKDDWKEFYGNLHFEDNVYWWCDQGDNAICAYCPHCVDGESHLKMRVVKKFISGFGKSWYCPHCKLNVPYTEPPK